MTTYTVLTDQTVSISEVRKHPADYFKSTPVAVLSNNKPAGYMVSVQVFEEMVKALEQVQEANSIVAQFNPSASRLKNIAAKGNELLSQATDEELGDFSE